MGVQTEFCIEPWVRQYADLQRAYAESPSQDLLARAARLGRELAERGVTPEKMITAHAAAAMALADIDCERAYGVANGVSGLCTAMIRAASDRVTAPDYTLTSRKVDVDVFRALCQTAPIAMFLMGADCHCLYANPRLLHLFKIGALDWQGLSWTNLIPQDERELFLGNMRRAQQEGREFTAETRLIRAEDRPEWVSIRSAPLLDEDGREYLRLGTVADISARQAATEALQQSEAQFRTLAETIPAGILIYGDNGLVYVNQFMEYLTGYSRDELFNMMVWDIVHPDMRDLVKERAERRLVGDDVSLRYEIKMLTRSGEERWLDYSASFLSYRGDRGVLGIGLDITDRKAAEEEAKLRNAELMHVERVSTLGKMASEIAHELNQPLAAIVNYANGCQRRAEDGIGHPSEILPAIEEMRNEAERASEIIKRMRDYVRRHPARQSTTEINAIVDEALELAMVSARRPEVAVEFDLQENLSPVYVDRVQITQVLVNLISNALDSMSGMPGPLRRLDIATRPNEEGAIEISVKDVGEGLKGVRENQLFEPFFTTKPNGLGLGLSICQSIVESHGGRLWPTPNEDRGVTFTFTLPTTEGAES